MSERPLTGRLLVASPAMRDPNFERTVVLVLEHGDDGALGVVLNRPSGTDLFEALPRWDALAAAPHVVFVGGPVAPSAAICLGRPGGGGHEGCQPLFDGLCSVDLERDPAELARPPAHIRVFAGYAGWGPGQVEGEVEAGAWYVLDALPGDALSPQPTDLWAAVLRRQGGTLALLVNFPADPTMN
ncbi:MAG: YqgE/AlgH family protein [Acidimicrobiales bacterium]